MGFSQVKTFVASTTDELDGLVNAFLRTLGGAFPPVLHYRPVIIAVPAGTAVGKVILREYTCMVQYTVTATDVQKGVQSGP